MFELTTEITIAASAERVWAVLVDMARWPEWNPFLVAGAGDLVEDERIHVTIQQAGGKPMHIAPRVLKAEPAQELRWRGRLIIPGLFAGEHAFVLHPESANVTRFVQTERFTGILIPFFRRMLDTETRAGFEAMNAALKARAESER